MSETTPAIALFVVGGILLVSGWKNQSLTAVFAGSGETDPAGAVPTVTSSDVTAALDPANSLVSSPSDVEKGSTLGSPVTDQTSVGPLHETAGLAGYPAHDYFAPAGSPCVAPVSGTVHKLSGHDPKNGPTQGVHGPFGWSVYIKADKGGKDYYLTHMGTRTVHVGQHVKQGQKIGTVGNYAKWGGANHIHMGVHG